MHKPTHWFLNVFELPIELHKGRNAYTHTSNRINIPLEIYEKQVDEKCVSQQQLQYTFETLSGYSKSMEKL